MYGTPAKPPFWTTGKIVALVLGVIAVIVIVIGVATVAFVGLSESSVNMSVPRDAEIGDCYRRFESSQEPVDCDGFHHYEVYAEISYPADHPYPGRFERLIGPLACEAEFEAFTGESYWTSALSYSSPYPTEEEWAAGERRTVCALHHAELKPLRGSQAG